MALRQPNWTRLLTILLVILASIALLYISLSVLERFASALVLFTVGALVAYVMTPLVNRLKEAFHFRWLAILLAYGMVAVLFFALGVLLFTPFVQQSQSLVNNLHNPSAPSIARISTVQSEAAAIERVLSSQAARVNNGQSVDVGKTRALAPTVAALERNVRTIAGGNSGNGRPKHQTGKGLGGRVTAPPPSTQVPPSYTPQLTGPVSRLASDFAALQADPSAANSDPTLLSQPATDAGNARKGAAGMYHVMSTTPILLLRAQVWLDQHHIHVDLASKFGQAAQQLSAQGTSLLNNAITILSETANILLDFVLVLIISFYLLGDGGSMIRRAVNLVPAGGRQQAYFFVTSLDRVLGGYIRGQIVLSITAGILGGGGAAVLGVPYPLLIGIMTSLLELVPVIGPMVAAVPAVSVALFFTPVPTALIFLAWYIVFQQVVTNLIGPRIMGMAVGISPIEALLAVLVGYPLGGFLGAFLAVPVAGILHILVREAYNYFVLGHALPSMELPSEQKSAPQSEPKAAPTLVPPKHDSAASR